MRFRTGGDGDYHWEDGDLATCSWKVLTTCTCHGDERERDRENCLDALRDIMQSSGERGHQFSEMRAKLTCV